MSAPPRWSGSSRPSTRWRLPTPAHRQPSCSSGYAVTSATSLSSWTSARPSPSTGGCWSLAAGCHCSPRSAQTIFAGGTLHRRGCARRAAGPRDRARRDGGVVSGTRAWQLLTVGNYPAAAGLARDAQSAAPRGSSAHVQATAQEGRALARLGDSARSGSYAALSRVEALVSPMRMPSQPEHHYRYDPAKSEAYAATTLSWLAHPAGADVAPLRARTPPRPARARTARIVDRRAAASPPGGVGPDRSVTRATGRRQTRRGRRGRAARRHLRPARAVELLAGCRGASGCRRGRAGRGRRTRRRISRVLHPADRTSRAARAAGLMLRW